MNKEDNLFLNTSLTTKLMNLRTLLESLYFFKWYVQFEWAKNRHSVTESNENCGVNNLKKMTNNRKISTLFLSVIVLLTIVLTIFLLNSNRKYLTESNVVIELQNDASSNVVKDYNIDVEVDFFKRLFKALPLETQLEKEYFGKAIVLTGLDPYSAIISPHYNVSVFGFEGFSPMHIPDLISYFFPPEFIEKESSKNMTDFRLQKDVYIVKRNNTNSEITTKVPGLKVHALINHELEYRDDFLEYPLALPKTTKEYCQSDNLCLTNNGKNLCSICDQGKDKRQSKFFYGEWCSLPNIDLSIISIRDGILDYGTTHPEARFNIYDKYGNIFTLSHHLMKYHKGGNWQIEHYPLLASIGTTYYPGAFGHFPIEILPRVIFLHRFIPLHIPIVIYDYPFCRSIINELYQYNVLPKSRKIVWAKTNTYYVASRLYFIHSKSEIATPLTPDIILRMSSTILKKPFIRGFVPNPYPENEPFILVLDRSDSGSRIIRNNDEMVRKVEKVVGKRGVKVLNVKLTTLKSFFMIGQAFLRATAIIAPHGAGLANINTSSLKLKFIIEIGWKGFPGNFGWPGDYYCQARGLGLKYYAVTTTRGDYFSTFLDVDVNEVAEIVEKEMN